MFNPEDYPGRSEENHEKISVGTVGVPAEIRTERLSNVKLECFMVNA
jgi:hypothetical protein